MTAHNHPPRCCCEFPEGFHPGGTPLVDCPLCIEHGELAQLPEPQCTSCRTVAGHPHTEYCQLVDHASQLTHLELNGPIEGPHYAKSPRPVDRPECGHPDWPDCPHPHSPPPCSSPRTQLPGGRPCADDACPRHGNTNEDEPHDHVNARDAADCERCNTNRGASR